jgi:hypothetical protein
MTAADQRVTPLHLLGAELTFPLFTAYPIDKLSPARRHHMCIERPA